MKQGFQEKTCRANEACKTSKHNKEMRSLTQAKQKCRMKRWV